MISVPLLYFPPRLAFVDDNTLFLESLSDSINENIEKETFISPKIFVERIKSSEIHSEILGIFNKEDEYLEEQSMISIDLSTIPSMLLDFVMKKRPISVSFIDFNMPSIDGISVCKQISKNSCRKVLLTGELCSDDVIKSFNKKEIDGYISKSDSNFVENVNEIVDQMHDSYINRINACFMPFIIKNEGLIDLYNNPVFANIFKKLVFTSKNILSCVYDNSGSVFLFENDGTTTLINVYSSEEIKYSVLPSIEEEGVSMMGKVFSDNNGYVLDYKGPNNSQVPNADQWRRYVTKEYTRIEGKKDTYFITAKKYDISQP